MTIDRLLNTIIPQYVRDERKDYPDEKAAQRESLRNPLVPWDRTHGLPDRDKRSREDDAVVTLSGRPVALPQVDAPEASQAYFANRTIPFSTTEFFFARVRSAYAFFDQKNYKGLNVDKLA